MGKYREHNNEPKDGETAKLKRHIRHLEKENKKLKSELRTYERVFSKNITFLKERTRGLSLEDLIAGANVELTAQQITDDKVQKFDDLQRKWRCFQCEEGLLKLIIIPHGGGSNYFRLCSNPKCKHRTEVKTYTEEVEGIK